MTDIEKKALALLNECAGQEVYGGWGTFDPNQSPCTRALCRAIEQHEAFKQEVSDAVELANMRVKELKRNTSYIVNHMQQFIIPKPVDPLVEAVTECDDGTWETKAEYANKLRAAIKKRGGKIVWGEGE